MGRPRKHIQEIRFCPNCKSDQPFYPKDRIRCARCYRALYRVKDWYRTPERNERYRIKERHGITPQEYKERLAADICPCGLPATPERPLVYDHDHITGEFRGGVHRTCNFILGLAQDDPVVLQNLARYLTKSKK